MIEQDARVVAVEAGRAWVETRRESACGACAMNKGCGAGLLAKAFGFSSPRLRVSSTEDVAVGDRVVVGIDERALVRGSFAAYMVPILFMLGFSIVGQIAMANWLAISSDLLSLSCGITGLAAGLLWLRRYSRRAALDGRYQPVILRKDGVNYPSRVCMENRVEL